MQVYPHRILRETHHIPPADCPTWLCMQSSMEKWVNGQPKHALNLAREAARRGIHCTSEWDVPLQAEIWLATLTITLRQHGEAERSIATAEHSAVVTGNHRHQAVLTLLRAALNWNLGRVSTALEQARSVLGAPEETAKSWKPYARVLLALGALRRADLRTAGAYARQAAMDWALGNTHGPACAWMVVQTTEAEHGAEAAAPLVDQLISPGQARERLLLTDPAAAAWLARFMVLRNRRNAEAIAVTARTLSTRSGGLPALEAAARHAEGLVHRSAADLLFAADHHPDPWAAASAREDLGVMLAAQGSSGRAGTVLEHAAAGYLTAQSPRDVARVQRRLHRLGRSCDHADRPQEPGTGILGLTKTETAVAELVALGLSNAQAAQKLFISRHTVAHHLRSIFKKLHISSRVELARTWMESCR
ncbi:regulatory protein, luxR family [Streptomyces sp. KS_16]|nr:regulatory LuxR family protein [Streptomyces sp. 2321.6]SDR58118.1 regulatory protein, luxR family [Streptomyces sp. KS_16]SEB79331.1 regulatory protein, luxR family [Streptomyces sp. 2133.1]SNC61008.1 regulatory protein, luxR family [Streptomyces sp. 2114.4]